MKNVLIPTDLSESTDNAVDLAIKLVSGENTYLQLLHVIPAPSGVVLNDDGSVKDDKDLDLISFQDKSFSIKSELENKFKGYNNLKIKVIIGEVNSVILNELKSKEYNFMVLGMTGELASDFWSNSHVEYLSKHAGLPILTLKCDRSNLNLDKIVFVSDFLHDDNINLDVLKTISNKFHSELILLKVITKDQQRTDYSIEEMANRFAKNNSLENFKIELHKASNVEDGIVTYCNENHIDLIAIGTHQRDGFSTLFRKSISQNIVRDLYHPIITFPIS